MKKLMLITSIATLMVCGGGGGGNDSPPNKPLPNGSVSTYFYSHWTQK